MKLIVPFALLVLAFPAVAADVELLPEMVTTAVIETSIKEVFKDDLAKIEDLNGLASLRFRDGTDIQIAADTQNSRVILFEVKRLSPASKVAYLELANRLNDNMNFGISFVRRDQDTPKGEPDRWLLISKTYLPYGSKLSIAKLCSYLREFWHGYASGNLKKLDPDDLIIGDLTGESPPRAKAKR